MYTKKGVIALPVGMIILVILAILIFFGLAQRILDRMHLSDRQAIFFLLAIAIGSFIDIPLSQNPTVSINVGGGILPIVLAIYLLSKAGSSKEWIRAIVSAILTGALIYGIRKIINFDPGYFFLDLQYAEAGIAGLVAYLAGRSRRSAFIAGSMGILLVDIATLGEIIINNAPGNISIGGAGAFDSIVIAGVIGVLLAEIIGETRERLQGGPSDEREYPAGLKLENLQEEETKNWEGGKEHE